MSSSGCNYVPCIIYCMVLLYSDLSPNMLTLKWLRKEQLLPEDGTVLPKHVGGIVKNKNK
jgi:hypothetical protein